MAASRRAPPDTPNEKAVKAMRHVRDEIMAQLDAGIWKREAHSTRIYLAQLAGVLDEAQRAAPPDTTAPAVERALELLREVETANRAAAEGCRFNVGVKSIDAEAGERQSAIYDAAAKRFGDAADELAAALSVAAEPPMKPQDVDAKLLHMAAKMLSARAIELHGTPAATLWAGLSDAVKSAAVAAEPKEGAPPEKCGLYFVFTDGRPPLMCSYRRYHEGPCSWDAARRSVAADAPPTRGPER